MDVKNVDRLKEMVGKYITKKNSKINHWMLSKLIDVTEGSVTCQFEVTDAMLNLNGTLHGGIAAAMMDDLMGLTIYSIGENNFFASMGLDVRFFRPVAKGDLVKASSKIIRRGRRVINIECSLTRSDGKLAAKCFSDMLRTERPLTSDLFVPIETMEKIHF